MNPSLVYLIGAPAAGKSTLMAAITQRCHRASRTRPFAHDVLITRDGAIVGAELGRRRGAFSGTDALSMSVSPLACKFVADKQFPLVLGEGDRLAHLKFLDSAADAGLDVYVVYLDADRALLDQRAKQRGSTQNAAWRSGRATKARRLHEAASERYKAGRYKESITLFAEKPVEALAEGLLGALPCLEGLV